METRAAFALIEGRPNATLAGTSGIPSDRSRNRGSARLGMTMRGRARTIQNRREMYSRIWCFQYGQSWPPWGPQLSR
jgi:hypothetical protein